MTAANAADLRRQAYDAGAASARSQGPGKSLLVLDFGAARLRNGTHGATLRSGTFFSNEEIGTALEEAARGYHDHHERGSVTIVYANSNAFLSRPGKGYKAFDEGTARKAGEQQAKTLAGLDLPSHVSATVGGDIEPGYDIVGPPEVSIAMVAGANSVSGKPYHDVGTAPCTGRTCTNGWTPRDVCAVASGEGRAVLPEIYFDGTIDQPSQWAEVQKACRIDAFAGVSSSPVGSFSPQGSWEALRGETSAHVHPIIVVWPGAETTGAQSGGAGGIGRAMTGTLPAQIDAHPQTFVSADHLRPTTNAWRAASHERLTEVDAGALAADRSTGAFAIFRHEFLDTRQEVTVVEVDGSGPLRITDAPIGKGVVESAQTGGEIEFTGARGVRGTLHLSDDSVTLNAG